MRVLVLLPLLMLVVVDVNGQLSSTKSIIDCAGKEGKVKLKDNKNASYRIRSTRFLFCSVLKNAKHALKEGKGETKR